MAGLEQAKRVTYNILDRIRAGKEGHLQYTRYDLSRECQENQMPEENQMVEGILRV